MIFSYFEVIFKQKIVFFFNNSLIFCCRKPFRTSLGEDFKTAQKDLTRDIVRCESEKLPLKTFFEISKTKRHFNFTHGFFWLMNLFNGVKLSMYAKFENILELLQNFQKNKILPTECVTVNQQF